MGCWNSNSNGIRPVDNTNKSLNKEWEREVYQKKPRTAGDPSVTMDNQRRSVMDNSRISISKDHSADRLEKHDKIFEDEDNVKPDAFRRHRLRTEKQVALIAKQNPEMLDQKAKEIISGLNIRNLKRNNQLQSLDGPVGNANFKSMEEDNKENSMDPFSGRNPAENGRGTPTLPQNSLGTVDEMVINTKTKSSIPEETPRSYNSKTSSLNRARIINLDDLKEDPQSSERAIPVNKSYGKKQTVAAERKKELEDLLHEIDEDSEKGFNVNHKLKKRLTSEFSDGPQSTNVLTSKFTQPYNKNPTEEVEAEEFNLDGEDQNKFGSPKGSKNLDQGLGKKDMSPEVDFPSNISAAKDEESQKDGFAWDF